MKRRLTGCTPSSFNSTQVFPFSSPPSLYCTYTHMRNRKYPYIDAGLQMITITLHAAAAAHIFPFVIATPEQRKQRQHQKQPFRYLVLGCCIKCVERRQRRQPSACNNINNNEATAAAAHTLHTASQIAKASTSSHTRTRTHM